jgi:two-component system, cell cycle response regulator
MNNSTNGLIRRLCLSYALAAITIAALWTAAQHIAHALNQNGSDERHFVILQWALILGTLFSLGLQAYFLFRPAIRMLRDNVGKLEAASLEIAEQRQLLEEQNQRLQTDHKLLQETTLSLEAANFRIETAARRFEELFQGLPVACVGYDAEGRVYEWNRACELMFDISAGDMYRRSIYELFCTDAQTGEMQEIIGRVFEGNAIERLEWRLEGQEDVRYMLCSTFPIHGQKNRVSGAILSLVDITAQKRYEQQIEEQLLRINEYSSVIETRKVELEEANAKLEALASTDGLTNLRNHRAFQEALAREVKLARREHQPLSVILLDVDHFKQYNDTYGHPAGDAVLQYVASLLIECSRETDVIARYGGEEFVALLPNTDEVGAQQVAERMRQAIEVEGWAKRQVTASFGFAMLLPEQSPADLIEAADQALYISKAEGRNRVTSWHSIHLNDAA